MTVILSEINTAGSIQLGNCMQVAFDIQTDLRFNRGTFLPAHPNALELIARLADGDTISQRYYSIGGGTILKEEATRSEQAKVVMPHPFQSAAELLAIGTQEGISIGEMVRRNECAWRPAVETDAFLDAVHAAMHSFIDRGVARDGTLPGSLMCLAGLSRSTTRLLHADRV